MSESSTPATPPVDAVLTKLTSLGLTEAQATAVKGLGADSVDDLVGLTESDLTKAGVPTLKARKIITSLRPAKLETAIAPVMNFDTVLPSVPEDASWLNSLRAGGVLKIEQSTVIAAVRATLADHFGFYDIPKKLLIAIENQVDTTDEQVGEEYWSIRKMLTRRSYGDLFAAIEGLDGTFITEKRKDELLNRINTDLWPTIVGFYNALAAWQESWLQGSANPMAMMTAVLAAAGGGMGGMPPGMMQPPECGGLRDAAAAVNDAINRIFRGTGVQIAAALAYEANNIKAMIENTRLPILCGVASRDLLLKKLDLTVPATYPRLEQNVTKFILGIMESSKVASGPDELKYFGTLYMLGNQIAWADLGAEGSRRPRGIGAGSRFLGETRYVENEEDEAPIATTRRKPLSYAK